MNKVIFMRGLPGSGKSYKAQKLYEDAISNNKSAVILSADDLFYENGVYHFDKTKLHKNHKAIERKFYDAVDAKTNIIILDNTNTRASEMRYTCTYAYLNNYEIEFSLSDSPWAFDVEECFSRNVHNVPKSKIEEMKNRFEHNVTIKDIVGFDNSESDNLIKDKAIIVDIDGTVAHKNERDAFDWKNVGNDTPNTPVIEIVKSFHNQGYKIVFLSGRDSVCREQTIAWLKKHVINEEPILFMRERNDYRKDYIVKEILYRKYVKPFYNILFCLDDRDQVVDLWRKKLGLTCLQVNYGNF